jgi:adenosine deaminase
VLPKVHLHCHLEGALRAATFLELAAKHGVATTYTPKGGNAPARVVESTAASVDDVYRFTTFQEFLFTFAAVSRSLRDPEDYARLAGEFAQDALAQNVMYGELFISPSVWKFFHPILDVRTCVAAIREALDNATAGTNVRFALIVDLTRNFGPESALQTAKMALGLTDLGVIGVGLGGDERNFPPQLFRDAFLLARDAGLRTVAHAGEAAGPESVREALSGLRAERIGHGIRALEDPYTVDLLAREAVPLEICPTSNFLTGAASRDRPHPILELDAAGCTVIIDADDPALFGTSISAEYDYVESIAGTATLERFIANAIDASFARYAHKEWMRERLAEASAELRKQPRS